MATENINSRDDGCVSVCGQFFILIDIKCIASSCGDTGPRISAEELRTVDLPNRGKFSVKQPSLDVAT